MWLKSDQENEESRNNIVFEILDKASYIPPVKYDQVSTNTHQIIDGGRSIWDQLAIMVATWYFCLVAGICNTSN